MTELEFKREVFLAILPIMLQRALALDNPNQIPDELIIDRAWRFAHNCPYKDTSFTSPGILPFVGDTQ